MHTRNSVLLKYYTVKYIINIFSVPSQIIESGRIDYN